MLLTYFAFTCVLWALGSTQSTNFINKTSKISNFAQPNWFLENIPFIELPDRQIEEVYYYRFSTLKRHLRYSTPGVGYTITEFVNNVDYSQKFQTINGAAGHHIHEARWLRNPKYAEDYINFWAREGAANQQYSEWIAVASYAAYLLSGNTDFIVSQLPGFIENFNGWNDQFEPTLNLYFISPHDDAMEYSASSIQTDDPYHGGLGYRPSFNSEMYGNAITIAKMARLSGSIEIAEEFETRAAAIREGILTHLWDNERSFFYHMFRENNTDLELLDAREEIGFYPWRFQVPTNESKYVNAWNHLFDPEGFDSTYGPTTCEQRSKWFDGNQTHQCCWWNGNSWPYSTSFVINSLAAQIKSYKETDLVHRDSFVQVLHRYAETQYRDGKPYVAECHSPYQKLWVCDFYNHSEHYAHSTYTDNVLGDLLGIEGQSDDTLVIDPLVPATWAYFIVENLLYHGHNVTILYDSDGTKYNVGKGLRVYINGAESKTSSVLQKLMVEMPPSLIIHERTKIRKENYAANLKGYGYPMVDASYTSPYSSPWQATDGRIVYDYIPSNRWSNFGSTNEFDWFSIDFGPGRTRTIDQVRLYVYSDVATNEGEVDCPDNVVIETLSISGGWEAPDNQGLSPTGCVQNDVLTVYFDAVTTQKIRLLFYRNEEQNWFVGITEIEIWAPWPQVSEDGVYEAEDGYISDANIHASDSASGGSYVGQINNPGSSVEFCGIWIDTPGNYDVAVYYSNGFPDMATLEVSANNIFREINSFPPTVNGWGQFDSDTFTVINVPLLRGDNSIILKHIDFFAEIDKIKVIT